MGWNKFYCEDQSPIIKKMKTKHIQYEGKSYIFLFEIDNTSFIIRSNNRGLPYGVIEKVPSSNIFI